MPFSVSLAKLWAPGLDVPVEMALKVSSLGDATLSPVTVELRAMLPMVLTIKEHAADRVKPRKSNNLPRSIDEDFINLNHDKTDQLMR
jgi:hypothetical protein